jgi:hypothetical protein
MHLASQAILCLLESFSQDSVKVRNLCFSDFGHRELSTSESQSKTDVGDEEKQLYYSVFKGKYSDFINNIYLLISRFLFVLLFY